MSLLDFFDIRTLLVCQAMLAFVFSTVFFVTRHIYPRMRGIHMVALSFALIVPHAVLLAMRDHITPFLSIFLGNLLLMGAQFALYEALLRFNRNRGHRALIFGAMFLAMGVISFFSEIRSSIVPRIVALSVVNLLIHSAMAQSLLRAAKTSEQRVVKTLFAIMILLVAGEELSRAIMTLLHGAPSDLMQPNPIQTTAFVTSLLSMALCALFFFVLYGNEQVLHTRMEAHHDPLSGTLNRRGLGETLEVEQRRLETMREPYSVALIDIDHFKEINDIGGHAAGDAVIRSIAQVICWRILDMGYVGRFGGDEFLVILPRMAAAEALAVAEQISDHIRTLPIADKFKRLTVSAGITEARVGEEAEELLSRADLALYRAKSEGRNRCKMLSDEDYPPMTQSAVA
jgi:diguanylate cyclase (GGDEF)-like protein